MSSSPSVAAPTVAAPVEHIVLIKVRPEAAASGAAAAMVSALQALLEVSWDGRNASTTGNELARVHVRCGVVVVVCVKAHVHRSSVE